MFGLHMVHSIFPEYFKPNEWDFILGNIATAAGSSGENSI